MQCKKFLALSTVMFCYKMLFGFQLEKQLKDQMDELVTSRQAKEEALKEKQDIEQRHDVLRAYFNEREAELQVSVL